MPQSLEVHYNELLQLLRANHACWDQEVLNSYPESIDRPPKSWIDSVASMSLEQMWHMDSKKDFSFIENQEMRECFEKLELLTALPQKIIQSNHSYNEADAFFGVRGKKRHEIAHLAPVLKEIGRDDKVKRVIDVGGGQGHLGRVISKHFGVPTLSIDRDPRLIAQGKINVNRLQHRILPNGAAPIDFEENFIRGDGPAPISFNSESFILGLHTCGDLAWHLMQHGHQANCPGLLSFGCCYNKMELDKNGKAVHGPKELPLDQYSLTLATRGHKSDSRQAFDLKLQVKRHRYSLHLFHYHQKNVKRFIPMGETQAREYLGAFSDYAMERLHAHGIDAHGEELEEFYQKDWVQATYKKMLYANLIRWQFGRALEMVILLDRCLKLQAKGFKVELATYFDEKKSPRNIGILARK